MVSIIYYTSNHEEPKFEKKIQDNILKVTSLPIISISQKSMDFGHNICVGETVASYLNEWNQILIGLKEAKTEFCIAAESDCLYPPEYFTFIPPRNDVVYKYDNVWVYFKNTFRFWKKNGFCEGAQICGREYWIERLESTIKALNGKWGKLALSLFPTQKTYTGNPIITFKTGRGVNNKTGIISLSKVSVLPYWGTGKEIQNIL